MRGKRLQHPMHPVARIQAYRGWEPNPRGCVIPYTFHVHPHSCLPSPHIDSPSLCPPSYCLSDCPIPCFLTTCTPCHLPSAVALSHSSVDRDKSHRPGPAWPGRSSGNSSQLGWVGAGETGARAENKWWCSAGNRAGRWRKGNRMQITPITWSPLYARHLHHSLLLPCATPPPTPNMSWNWSGVTACSWPILDS